MPKSTKAKAKAKGTDPDKMVRQPDGGYRTGDERFGVGPANGSWFLTDQQTADEFGQPRVTGPFTTLNAVREAIPEARSAPTSIRKPIKQTPAAAKPGRAAPPPPKPKTWLEKLSTPDRRRAQRMIAALEAAGLADAEEVARARIEGRPDRKLATRLLRARLDRVVDDAGADEDARRLVAEVVRMLSGEGRIGPDLPGWALVETDVDGSLTDRLIDLD